MLVIHEDGAPVSMLSLLPVTVTIGGEKHAARYVYAVATLPEYRRKGYASKVAVTYSVHQYFSVSVFVIGKFKRTAVANAYNPCRDILLRIHTVNQETVSGINRVSRHLPV